MMSRSVIRHETSDDIAGIRRVNEAAFNRTGEADLVDALRSDGALTISAVTTIDDEIVAHLAISPVTIEAVRGSFPAHGLGPVCVAPEYQKQGMGSALIRWSLEQCRQAGHHVIVLLGNSNYYSRFGFVSTSVHGIAGPFPVQLPGDFMVIELSPSALTGHTGVIKYHSAFNSV